MTGTMGPGTTRRHKAFDVTEHAQRLQTVEVEVHERDGSQRPRDGDGARGGLRTRNQANNVSDEDEEEQRAQKRDVLLETLTDNVLANARVHEVIAILDRVEELVLRDQLKLAASNQNHHQYQRQNEEHVQRVLADVPSTDREYGVGIERFGEVPCLFDELIGALRPSQIIPAFPVTNPTLPCYVFTPHVHCGANDKRNDLGHAEGKNLRTRHKSAHDQSHRHDYKRHKRAPQAVQRSVGDRHRRMLPG